MPFSPKGHFDPPSSASETFVRVVQQGATIGWGWVERHSSDPRIRMQAWVRGPDFDPAPSVTTHFLPRDSTDFPQGTPTTRAQFFDRLAAQWTSGATTVHCEAYANEGPPPNPPSGEFDPGTELVFDSADNHVGFLFVDPDNDIEHFVSHGSTVGPDEALTLKVPGTGGSFGDLDAFLAAMYAYLNGKAPPHRYEVTTQSVVTGVVAPNWGS